MKMKAAFYFLYRLFMARFTRLRTIARRTLSPEAPSPRVGLVQVAFFDADQTLRFAPSGSPYPISCEDVALIPGTAAAIREANRNGYLVAIVSNQLITKSLTPEISEAALQTTVELLAREGARVDYFDFAEANDSYRKPDTGMAECLLALLKSRHGDRIELDRERSYMVGDAGYRRGSKTREAERRPDGTPGTSHSNADRLFAENLGIHFFEADRYFWSVNGRESK